MNQTDKMKRCISSFITSDGKLVREGAVLAANDPLAVGRDALFVDVEEAKR